jgi:adenylate kinase
MTQRTVALLGVSGVGKSTILRMLSTKIEFQHLQASALIKEGRQAKDSDSLRLSDIDDNQRFLIAGFHRSVDPRSRLVLLDGHSVIDTPTGLVPIDIGVFSAIGIQQIICLIDDPEVIERRRANDTSRNRPQRDAGELKSYQDTALLHSAAISMKLAIPLHVLAPSQLGWLLRLIVGQDIT